jgi:prepilin-type N-terminal cleavage/methylation domain-containing protein
MERSSNNRRVIHRTHHAPRDGFYHAERDEYAMRYGRWTDLVIGREGMTLVELLVVVTIVLLLAAATIPRFQPGIDRSRIREAARSLQLYLSSARNQAIATGRSCGVMIERLPAEAGCSMLVSQVESPPPYCGDGTPTLANVTVVSAPPGGTATVSVTAGWTAIKAGDLVQFDYQGPYYTVATASASAMTATLDLSQGQAIPWTTGLSTPVPFKVFRQPVKSAASALQFPSPAVIDLTLSGPDPVPATGTATFWYTASGDTTPLTIIFAADGSIDRVYVENVITHPVTPIYLLVGKRENVNDPNPQNSNLQASDAYNNLWLAINPRTGLIVTTELAATGAATGAQAVIYQSRAFARQSDAMGGK